jgi:hypothetical protein
MHSMAIPALLRSLRRLLLIVFASVSAQHARATTFPLPIPKRSTNFPLQRPTQAGEVVAWGTNNFGQITIPASATNVVAIAAGYDHSLALRSDGTAVAWGDNSSGQCNVPATLTNVVNITAGFYHNLALRADGRVVAWGISDSRTSVPSLTDAVGIAVTRDDSFALRLNGDVIRWGTSGIQTNAINVARIFSFFGSGSVQYILANGTINFGTTYYIAAMTDGLANNAWIRTDGFVMTSTTPPGLRAFDAAGTRGVWGAIQGDGTVTTWLDYSVRPEYVAPQTFFLGLTNPPPRLRGVISIKAGESHFLALKLPSPPIPSVATASAQIVNGFIVGLNVLDGGEGYAEPPHVTISGGGGSGATANAQIAKGIVTGFEITATGSKYTGQPTITIDPPPVLPLLAIAPSRVNVTMQVVPGKRYQLESSNDLPNFSPVGSAFTATSRTLTNEFTISETGQFFRIEEIP